MRRVITWRWILFCTLGLLACLWVVYPHVLAYGYENLRYGLDPTSARAFEYGEKHFNATRASHYDIDRAEYFFNEAAVDPSLPYIYHELARIAFLKGDFNLALARIDLQISLHGTTTPNSYYVRGLIKGFAGDYAGAVKDYETYLRTDSRNWAAINDYAWVLLKADRPKEALIALDWGLMYWPENPWLHNSRATALFELERFKDAREAVEAAYRTVGSVDEADWLEAYPGNDPLIASEGITAFKKAVEENMHTITLALEKELSRMR